jgi:hypothetical protein
MAATWDQRQANQYQKHKEWEYCKTPEHAEGRENAEGREDAEAQEPTRESQRYTEPIKSNKFEYRSSGWYAKLFMETTL